MISTWKLTETSADLADIQTRESLMAQGNGYIGWRGTFEEGANGSLEGTYINGFYETYPIKYPESAYGFAAVGQTMLHVMNAKPVQIRIDGELVAADSEQTREYKRELDFQAGLLRREFIYTTKSGKELQVKWERLLSFTMPHCGVLRCSLTPLNFTGPLEIRSAIDTATHNLSTEDDPRVGSHLPKECFKDCILDAEEGMLYAARTTRESGFSVACGVVHELSKTAAITTRIKERRTVSSFTFTASAGEEVLFTKWIAYDTAKQEIEPEAFKTRTFTFCITAKNTGYENVKAQQQAYLDAYWADTDIEIGGDQKLQQGLRFNGYHILQSVGRDGKTNIAAKGLTGEGYEGHYFWDTELFVIPYLLYSNPAICRKLLEYRYSLLDHARARAREMAHPRGALFPWRTIGGGECSAYYPAGTAQYHINADIALAVKKYIQSTDDQDFLLNYGAEILFETARLFADLGHYIDPHQECFCIDCVTGPDEYTAVVNNNFYTNLLARENLWYAAEVYQMMEHNYPQQLKNLTEKIGLEDGETDEWKRAGDAMYLPYDEEHQINLQDDSFMQKAEWDFEHTPRDKYPLLLNFHPLVIYRHKVLKQADTILADFVLDKYMSEEQIRRDYDYYEVRTTHDSSLSSCVYGIVACQIGKLEDAYQHFRKSARGDLDNRKGNTKDGVHIANMAGTGMCIINGFAGLRQWDDRLLIAPQKPAYWDYYRFRLRFQERKIEVLVEAETFTIRLLSGEALTLTVCGEPCRLTKEKPLTKPYQNKAAVSDVTPNVMRGTK